MVQRDSDLKNIIPGSVAIQSLALTDGLGIQLCSLTVILRAKGGIALFFNSFCTRLGIYFFLDNDLGLRQYGRSRCRICWCCVLIPNRIQCLQENMEDLSNNILCIPIDSFGRASGLFCFLTDHPGEKNTYPALGHLVTSSPSCHTETICTWRQWQATEPVSARVPENPEAGYILGGSNWSRPVTCYRAEPRPILSTCRIKPSITAPAVCTSLLLPLSRPRCFLQCTLSAMPHDNAAPLFSLLGAR